MKESIIFNQAHKINKCKISVLLVFYSFISYEFEKMILNFLILKLEKLRSIRIVIQTLLKNLIKILCNKQAKYLI